MNYQIYETYNKIKEILEESHLPIGAAYYMVKDILNDLSTAYLQAATMEADQPKEPQKKVLASVDLNKENKDDSES